MKRPYEQVVFPGGISALGLAPEQCAWLEEQGHVRRAGQVWRALTSKAEIEKLVIESETAKCDFCSDRPVVTVFGAGEFDFLPHVPLPERTGSTGGWAACKTCAGLVRAGDEIGLHEHCVRRLMGVLREQGLYPTGPEIAVVEESIRAAQADFWMRRDKTETEVEQ